MEEGMKDCSNVHSSGDCLADRAFHDSIVASKVMCLFGWRDASKLGSKLGHMFVAFSCFMFT